MIPDAHTDAQRATMAMLDRAFDASHKVAVRLSKDRGVPVSTELLHEAHLLLAGELDRQGHHRPATALRDIAMRVLAEVRGELPPSEGMVIDPDTGAVVFLDAGQAVERGFRQGELDDQGEPILSPLAVEGEEALDLVRRWRATGDALAEDDARQRATAAAEAKKADRKKKKRNKAAKAARRTTRARRR